MFGTLDWCSQAFTPTIQFIEQKFLTMAAKYYTFSEWPKLELQLSFFIGLIASIIHNKTLKALGIGHLKWTRKFWDILSM